MKGIGTRQQLNKVEAANIAKALATYLGGAISRREAPFDYTWFLQLHREMFEDVWGWAGRLRRSTTSIGIEPIRIEQELYQLAISLPYWKDYPILKQATLLHHKAVHIHPFENGNGRWSRLLANIWLHLHEKKITVWPATELSELSPIRSEYIEAIKAADCGDIDRLLKLHEQFTRPE